MSPINPAISSTEDLIAEFRAGRPVILVDEEDRENEGDLILPAEFVTPEIINFMVTHCRGLVCLTITEDRARQLGLVQMASENKAAYGTAFTVSIEAAEGVTTGISAHDRARTVQAAIAKNATPDDIVQPGHIFPITARAGGVLVRAGHTEAGCDLAELAGLEPASVICEIMREDGSMARLPDLLEFAAKHGFRIGTIADLIHYRAASETLVEHVLQKPVTTAFGEFVLHAYLDATSGMTHLALVKGEIPEDGETLVRVHESVSVLDFIDLSSRRAAFSIQEAGAAISENGHGVIVLMNPNTEADMLDRLAGKTGEHLLKRNPQTSVAPQRKLKWDPRTYGIGAQILRDLGVRRMRLLATPHRMPSMAGFALEVAGFVASPEELGQEAFA